MQIWAKGCLNSLKEGDGGLWRCVENVHSKPCCHCADRGPGNSPSVTSVWTIADPCCAGVGVATAGKRHLPLSSWYRSELPLMKRQLFGAISGLRVLQHLKNLKSEQRHLGWSVLPSQTGCLLPSAQSALAVGAEADSEHELPNTNTTIHQCGKLKLTTFSSNPSSINTSYTVLILRCPGLPFFLNFQDSLMTVSRDWLDKMWY